MTDTELVERIKESSLLRGDFTLRSGRKSNYYLDKYLFATQPDILASLGKRFAKRIDHDVDRLAGAELGGIPLVAATSMATGKPSIFVRKAKKDYGTGKQLEGQLKPQDRVVIIEDIATTGGQTLDAANVLINSGAVIAKILVVIDRQEGARQNIEQAGFDFESLFTKADLQIQE